MSLQPKKGADAYQKTEVLTANRESILLMLYAGAARFLRAAIEATQAGQQADKAKYIRKTQDIVSELRATLNFKVSPDLAGQLDALYAFVTQRLLVGHAESDKVPMEEALRVLLTLQEGWEQAVHPASREGK